jgi:hypothetical protein
MAVNALDENVAVATMANVVGNCDNWELQYDFEMPELEEDFSEDALDHVDDDAEVEDWDDDDYEEEDWTDSRVPFVDDNGRGYN